MVLRFKKEDYERPPDDVYVAQVTKIDEIAPSAQHPEWGRSYRFSFRLLQEPWTKTPVSGMVQATWRPGNKLDKWLTALGVDSADIGAELDGDMLIGRQVKVLLETNAKSGYQNVKQLIALQPGTYVAPAPAAPVRAQVTPAPMAVQGSNSPAPVIPVNVPANTIPQPVVPPAPVAPPTVAPRKRPDNIPF